jgi:hypothetical protein
MEINTVHTELLIKEMETDGHAPLKFLCDDGNTYFCKYRITMNKEEMDCLAYEVVAHFLLKELKIPTPEIALVKITDDTLNKELIVKNRRLQANDICFGSKEIRPSSVLNDFVRISGKRDFNRILNPEDIIRIALFDLWVNNTDRGRDIKPGYNYNLLVQQAGSYEKIIAFDHGFIFGGLNSIGIFTKNFPSSMDNKIHLTPYYKDVIKYIDHTKFNKIVEDFVISLSHNYDTGIQHIIALLPKAWNLSLNLDKRISDYLGSQERIQRAMEIIKDTKK